MFDNIRGILTFSAVSPNEDRFINELRDSFVDIHNMRIENGMIMGEIYRRNYGVLNEIAARSNTDVAVVHKKGLIFKVLEYKNRAGIAIGILGAMLIVFYLTNIVMSIEVHGNENVSDSQIISVLADYGIGIGKYIPSIDIRASEKQIITALDNLSWIGIRSSGCRIIVNVSERTEIPQMVPSSSPCNIVSARDAQIIEIKNVHMGMLVPMLYDGVRKGEILISGTVNGKLDHDYYVHAMGEIIGRYDEKITFAQPLEDELAFYSEPVERKYLYLNGIRIPLFTGGNKYELFEYSEELEYFSIGKLNLPLGIVCARYKPYEMQSCTYTEEQAKDILNAKIERYEKNFYVGEKIIIVDREVQFTTEKDCVKAAVKYTLEGEIGVSQEIMAKY